MSIRLHVAVGYGLDLSGLDKSRLTDDDFLENDVLFESYRKAVLDYSYEYNDLIERINFHPDRNPAESFRDMLVYDPEFGYDDKVLLVPSSFRNIFTRYGNLLDTFQYESEPHDEPFENLWKEKPGTLYPFVNLMKKNEDKPFGIEKYWEPCYLDKKEFKEAIPSAPMHLWFLLDYLKLGKNTTDTFLQLRPTIYRYWS